MYQESTGRKIWKVIYPFLAMLAIYFAVVIFGIILFSTGSFAAGGSIDSYMGKNFALITSIGLLIIIVIEYLFYRKDYVTPSRLLYKKPLNFIWIILLGALFSHGLNLLFSLINISDLFQSYQAVEAEIYSGGTFFVILRTLILAPVAEELVFRGLIFRRMKNYTSFWPAALVSSAFFGIYHMNLLQGIYAFLFGLLVAAVYSKFKNLLAPIVMHFAANLLSVILTYTNAQYPNMTIYIIVMVLTFVLSALIYILVVRKVPEEPV